MQNNAEQYENNPDFLEFLNREFDKTAVDATIEELTEFTFGSFDEAVEAFEKYKGQR
jgi:superoxide dismutase